MKIKVVPDDNGPVDEHMMGIVALLRHGYSLSTVNKKLRRLSRPATAYEIEC